MGDVVRADSETEYACAAAELLSGLDRLDLVTAMTPQQPTRFIRAILERARIDAIPVSLFVSDLTARFDFLNEAALADLRAGRLSVNMLAGGAPRELTHLVGASNEGMWDTDRMLVDGSIPCNVYAVRVVDGDDTYQLGNGVGFTPSLVLRPGVRVGVEVAPRAEFVDVLYPTPPSWWGGEIRVVDRRSPVTVASMTTALPVDPIRDRIADEVAALVPERSTLEVGLGGVADALAQRLHCRSVRVHTGVLPTSFRDVRFTGRETADSDPDPMICTALDARAGCAQWSTRPTLLPISETHDPSRLAAIPSLWGVNSGYSVDLTGNVNAEWVGDLRRSVGGGQRDFTRAAHASERGGSVIALPSRTVSGRMRIVAAMPDHQVTTPSHHVDYVVTEWGVADLRGKSPSERVGAILSVAHPDDRPILIREV